MEQEIKNAQDAPTSAPPQLQEGGSLKRAFFSESFLEKLGLLLLTAAISGLLVPYIVNNLQNARAKNQVLLQTQSKLLDDVALTLMTYETLALDVSWYRTSSSIKDTAAHQAAYNRYREAIVNLFIQLRVETIRSRNLISTAASAKLDSFFTKIKLVQDIRLTQLHNDASSSDEEWDAMHTVSHQMLEDANNLVAEFATDLKLTNADFH